MDGPSPPPIRTRGRGVTAWAVGGPVWIAGSLMQFQAEGTGPGFEGLVAGAALATLATVAGLWVCSASWLTQGTLPVPMFAGAALSIAPLVPGTGVEPALGALALQFSGGATFVAGLIHESLRAVGQPIRISGKGPRGKLRRLRRDRPPAAVPWNAVEVGDRLALEPGVPLPMDVQVTEGRAFVGWEAAGGPAALPAQPKDVLLAGAEPRGEGLTARVLHPPSGSYATLRSQKLDEMRALAPAPESFERIAGWVGVLGAGAVAVSVAAAAPESAWATVPLILFAGVPGLCWIPAARARAASIEDAFRHGMWFVRHRDLYRFFDVRRFLVEPMLAAAPGKVEALALADVDGRTLVRFAEAALAHEDSPERLALSRARAEGGRPGAQAAAVREVDGIHYATVEGQRVWVGSPEAMAEKAQVHVPQDQQPALQFLLDQGMQVFVVATSDGGLLGAVGTQVAVREEIRRVGRELGAGLLPGLADRSRRALARASGLTDRVGLVRPSDASLLRSGSQPPRAGLRLRLLERHERPSYADGHAPRIFAAALAGLPALMRRIRNRRRQSRAVGIACGAGSLGAVTTGLAWLGPVPGVATAVIIGAVAVALAVPSRQPRQRKAPPAVPPPP
jgi:hypothetical protein